MRMLKRAVHSLTSYCFSWAVGRWKNILHFPVASHKYWQSTCVCNNKEKWTMAMTGESSKLKNVECEHNRCLSTKGTITLSAGKEPLMFCGSSFAVCFSEEEEKTRSNDFNEFLGQGCWTSKSHTGHSEGEEPLGLLVDREGQGLWDAFGGTRRTPPFFLENCEGPENFSVLWPPKRLETRRTLLANMWFSFKEINIKI